MTKVTILQHRLLHYRVELFSRLRARCAARGIQLEVVHGQASNQERSKKDEGQLSWAYSVRNRIIEIGGRDIIWQPIPKDLKDSSLIVMMQENRILSNYPLLLARALGKSSARLAYWGHGKNFQSDAPSGLREKWKNVLLTRVDWWFGYTEMTVDILKHAGFPAESITQLDNAIDTESFKADLASWDQPALLAQRAALGIEADAPVGLFCGSLYPDKRLELLVAAADLIRQGVPTFSLVVVGDGPSMPGLQAAAQKRPWMHLLGVRRGREKAMYFRLADVMLNPGLVGLHIVDAFCGGLVMITTRAARHSPEVAYLRDGINGIYAGDTPTEYGQAVLALIGDKRRLAAMQQAARDDAKRYTLDNMVSRFADGIEAALSL